MDRESK